ncbi:hypothetical protein [Ferrimonas marina]|uniref:Uncharacterized protein n=1 Tax=Ferrimonas marina TaxID=299255 RepID=A0A1M5U856_9GAMM|nr:hypothetical protein [Ferrimonas marina]SHH59100.1 hypothetical protein SAMN02745129_2446 [Ferrimonas marina]
MTDNNDQNPEPEANWSVHEHSTLVLLLTLNQFRERLAAKYYGRFDKTLAFAIFLLSSSALSGITAATITLDSTSASEVASQHRPGEDGQPDEHTDDDNALNGDTDTAQTSNRSEGDTSNDSNQTSEHINNTWAVFLGFVGAIIAGMQAVWKPGEQAGKASNQVRSYRQMAIKAQRQPQKYDVNMLVEEWLSIIDGNAQFDCAFTAYAKHEAREELNLEEIYVGRIGRWNRLRLLYAGASSARIDRINSLQRPTPAPQQATQQQTEPKPEQQPDQEPDTP